jgi:Ca2+-dependent lipid-binding protein
MAVKKIEKRFGTIAVEKGYITVDQLMDALDIQVRENLSRKKHRLIGKILYDLGYLTIDQIQRVLASMPSHVASMHSQSDEEKSS